MAPKTKAKKGKKGDDDHWDKTTESVANGPVVAAAKDTSDVDDRPVPPVKTGFAALAAGMDGDHEDTNDADDGAQSVVPATLAKSTTSNKKDKKKGKKGLVEEDAVSEHPAVEDSVPAPQPVNVPKGPIEMTPEDLADEEWGPVGEKGKKGKKAKGKNAKADGDDGISTPTLQETDEPQATPVAPPRQGEDEEDAPEIGTKILSKKEKEKLKKEREKAKKKAQAAEAKKVAEVVGETTPASIPAPDPPPPAPAPEPRNDDDGAEDADDGGGKADPKKKKKKKAKKDEEPAPAPAAATKKKGGISALKALMEEKKRLEEEAKRLQEEERKRIEEEERRAEEEAQRKELEKQRKKEKEKTKRELAKKEGRLLTKKEKERVMMANIRKQALLASGAQVEGLQQPSSNGAPKKVVYGNRKKKGLESKDAPSMHADSRPQSPQMPEDASERDGNDGKEEDGDDVKSDWDASSENDEAESKPAAAAEVKDSWDASSGEEDKESEDDDRQEEQEPAPTPKPVARTVATPPRKANDVPEPPTQPSRDDQNSAAPREKPSKPAVAPTKSTAQAPPKEQALSKEMSEEDSDSDEDSDSSSEEERMTTTQRLAAQRKAEAAQRRAKAHEEALAARNKDDLRSPICCILGHVDTGKTKLLDKIRQTNVQEGEAGGITQQIGATYFPVDAIRQKTAVLNTDGKQEYKVPGLLVIDTPGHESFTNLRSRGSSLCNIAILVVDILHGLEPQTLESLRLLRDRKTPFIVALNKIDRLYGWVATPDGAFQESLAKQSSAVQREFADRVEKTIVAFAEQGLNAALYYNNKNLGRIVSLVPTSAITGEGVPDMIMLLVNLTQQRMSDRLMYLSELECTVLEVKVIEGLGTTIDVILSNGILREGDKIVVCGLNGPIVTQVRALLTPQPLRELRVKSAYVHHKEVKAALGVKIVAPELEKAIAGSRLLVVGPDDDEDELREEVMTELNSIQTTDRGVCVQASTLGSLEALLDFLKSSKIPVSGVGIGPVHKKDIMRAAVMVEKAKELACILCFDVPVDKEAEKLADEMGIRLFKADIIYHLFDAFTAYNNELMEAKRRDAAPQAVWPCRLKIIAAFCKRDPIILGVDILDGSLRVGTPLAVVKTDPVTQKKEIIDLGRITSLEINHKPRDIVKKAQAGGGVAVKIEHAVYQSAKLFGRHFDEKDEVLSHITRQSIDVLKDSFKADVTTEEWLLIKALKPWFNII